MLNVYPTLPFVLTGFRALYLGLKIFNKMREGHVLLLMFFFNPKDIAAATISETERFASLGLCSSEVDSAHGGQCERVNALAREMSRKRVSACV